ncbi:MAG: hypothetical protein COV60_01445, partial [Candidatus Magasanikbacteria bacterium CG11_big_fil_rev_8_21_14_0_20_43_7]
MRSRNTATSLQKEEKKQHDTRLRIAAVVAVVVACLFTGRLFFLMVIQHGFYTALAAGSQTLYAQLFPERGSIFVQDSRTKEEFPVALNKDLFTIFVDTREIPDDDTAEHIAEQLSEIFQYTDEQTGDVYHRINKRDDPYEPIEKLVEETTVQRLKDMALPGIGFVRQATRFYPEGSLAAQTIGFVGKDVDGNDIGRYGIEGYWN